MTTIKLKNGSGAPTAGDLVQGEAALDLTNKRLYTEDSGGTVIEVGTNPGTDVTFADNRKAIFGAGSDLQIWHAGDASYIGEVGTGNLIIYGDTNIDIQNAAGQKTFRAESGGPAYLYHANNLKLNTTSTGIDVTGTVTADGLTVDGTATIAGAATAGFVTPLLAKNPSTNAASAVKIGFDAGGTTWGEIGSAYNSNDPYMAFYVRSGSEKLRITDAGNVGIGNTAPTGKLTISEAAGFNAPTTVTAANTYLQLGSADYATNGKFMIGFGYTDGATNTHSPAYMGFDMTSSSGDTKGDLTFFTRNVTTDTAPTERMRINSSGNVGIGRTSASQKLDVNGIIVSDSATNGFRASDGFSGAYYSEFSSDLNSGTTSVDTHIDSVAGTGWAAQIKFRTQQNGGTLNEVMRIASSGNVGIGTSSPADSLEVAGNVASAHRIRINNANASGAETLSFTQGSTFKSWIEFDNSTSNFDVWQYTNNALRFGTNNTERMRIDSSGNLLVSGTSTTPWGNATGTAADNQFIAREDGILGATAYKSTTNVGYVGYFNRTATDGGILAFNKNGSTVGSVGVNASNLLQVSSASSGGLFLADNTTNIVGFANGENSFRPASDNVVNLGKTDRRFKDLYLSSKVHLQYPGNSYYAKVEVDSSTNLILGAGPNGAEAARIDSSGNLLVGTTTTGPGAQSGVAIAGGATSSDVYIRHANGTSSGAVYAAFIYNTSQIGSITQNSTTGVLYNTSSDQRLKDNIVDAPSASDDIDAIQVRSFDWKADGSHQKYGMVAQELQSVAPEAVTGDADSDDMMGVDYSKLVPMLVKEIQSLRARVAQLEGEN